MHIVHVRTTLLPVSIKATKNTVILIKLELFLQ